MPAVGGDTSPCLSNEWLYERLLSHLSIDQLKYVTVERYGKAGAKKTHAITEACGSDTKNGLGQDCIALAMHTSSENNKPEEAPVASGVRVR